MSEQKVLIYGANGYTGTLIAEHAVNAGMHPIIAGRNKQAIETLGQQLALSTRIFSLDSEQELSKQLDDIYLVIHCAGPFSATAEPMMNACIKTKTHYIDITGEINVFELAQQLDSQAKQAGIVLCPGAGFDVIPTDCLASQLKEKMPDATHLTLGFDSSSGLSPGTAKTSVEGLAHGGKIRVDGKITPVPLAFKSRQIDFGNGSKNAVTIPWGDVSTAYHSTQIPNIEVYIPISPKRAKSLRRLNLLRWLFKFNWVQNKMKSKIDKTTQGPTQSQREKSRTYIWGEVKNAAGKTLTGRIETSNGYELTYEGTLEITRALLSNNFSGGAYTPSKLFGNDLIQRLPATSETKLETQ
ncbi:trans-acting enoyl reductase family protein [Pleionea sp. CnH1-48]|uniref:saccharopine dehydrogenase family protein n=1 Tax=Pleionea sp. CnH1-48 TaxID=2954494 RepID=UPI0020978A85|nr:saccharopine dehydrogenase NADP-binding domain-containing protein [Pleionea sp. CnH1-48]MCO7226484.1 saccharopine dehydrogenase NADP-binding domain-containing protein [Pleionea sp. CnH1-48]